MSRSSELLERRAGRRDRRGHRPGPRRRHAARRGCSSAARSGWASPTARATRSASSSRTPPGSAAACWTRRPGPLPEPRRIVLARPRQPQRPRAGQAPCPHAHARHAVPRGRAAAVGGRGVDGRRHPAPDPRGARVGPRGRRREDRAGGGRATGRRRAGRALRATVAIFADGDLEDGVEAGLAAMGHRLARAPYDGSLGHEHAIELVDGGPAAGGTLAATTDPRSERCRRSRARPPRLSIDTYRSIRSSWTGLITAPTWVLGSSGSPTRACTRSSIRPANYLAQFARAILSCRHPHSRK